jgi:ketosteroid isomerase-like protein
MASDDVELVTQWFDGLSRGELSLELCHPEITIRNWDESPLRGPYEGHEGVEHWWQDFADVIEDARFELLETVDLGNGRVLTVQRLGGTFRLTGIELEDALWGAITTVRDGKVSAAQGYASPGRAKKAAGLVKPA